jgi:glutamyl-tRNA synthetase
MSAPRVRFAPSPTGFLHIGGARTALFNWLYARRHGGAFILRIEDTDQKRSTDESVRAILDGLRWLGMDWDEGPEKGGAHGPYFQTERLASYREHADALVAAGKAFRCYCTQDEIKARRALFPDNTYKYEGTCRDRKDAPDLPYVIRFKAPKSEGVLQFDDRVIGKISKPYSDMDDFVMLRGDGIPLYNHGCVVDDHLMAITLVCRGQEHINSTFPQLMLYDALGWKPPEFAHLPLILAADGGKLSKRFHPDADLMHHKANGVLPQALVNFILRLGWSHGNDEVITHAQMIEWFDFDHVGSVNGIYNPEKLLWLNQQWLKALPPADIARELSTFAPPGVPADKLEKIAVALRPRAKTVKEMAEMASYFFSAGVTLDEKAAAKFVNPETKPLLEAARGALAELPAWATVEIDAVVKAVSEKASVGMGKVAQPLRVAVTGGTTSPGIGETLEIVGRDESLARIDAALKRA